MDMQGSRGVSSAWSLGMRQDQRRGQISRGLCVLLLALAGIVALPKAQGAQDAAAAHPTRAYWLDVKGTPPAVSATGARQAVRAKHFRTATLDRHSMAALAAGAPRERSHAARLNPVVLSLPDPSGGFQRFTVEDSPVMERGLAAKHPEIRTYAGRGIDDPTASIRISVTPLGFNASVRSLKGSWYIDPLYHLDQSLYASYYRSDLPYSREDLMAEAMLAEPRLSLARSFYRASDRVQVQGSGFAPGANVVFTVRNIERDVTARQTLYAVAGADGSVATDLIADPYNELGSYEITANDGVGSASSTFLIDTNAATTPTGSQLRTYRVAMVTDPTYATFSGGPAFVTAAKVVLMNRVTQVYETETSIRLVLIADTDKLNLDTAALATAANGPCGGTACFTAAQLASCGGSTLTRNRVVVGLLVGAKNYDVGHIMLGVNGGGVASLGVVGLSQKAQGCTGLPQPVGDFMAVDYVAHEMGHQFAGNHTFNGTVSNCSGGNRSAANSVEPGSGSSVMAYAGICGTDNLQPHSDPYWSQRSYDEILAHTSAAENSLSSIQMGVMTGFTTDGQQFQMRYNGNDSVAIVRGTNFTAAGIKAAIEGIAGWPVGGTVTASAVGDTAFTVTFGGTLTGINVLNLDLINCTGGCTGYASEITTGGPTARRGTVTATGNSPPVVTTTASYTIPVRTPFVLTGSGVDADGDILTYMWEQNDRGAAAGTGLVSNTKLNGPLFRQFGVAAAVTAANTLLYNSPGENLVTTNPTRVFPDMVQILANTTNAETGTCPLLVPASPSAAEIDCFSEFLPTAAYVGFAGTNASPASLNFRLTARDGRGGIGGNTTQLILASAAGPFLVTSPNTAVTLDGGSLQTVTWAVASTNVAPVSTANVKISLSTDGGNTFPMVLAASTPNSGSKAVYLPNVATTLARVKVEAVGNIFFDVSNANFTIKFVADLNGDNVVNCADLAIVKASMGKRTGQPGFDVRADVTGDGLVDVRDLSYVALRVPAGTVCP